MRRGTKSVLFGVHQFALHPLFVLLAWVMLYRSLPRFSEICAIITHDLGYWGSPNMDGEEGEQHPQIVADWWACRFGAFGDEVAALCIGHSRFHAAKNGVGLSKLFGPDKLATALYPMVLYLVLGNLSGEIAEYMDRCTDDKYDGLVKDRKSQILWLLEVRGHLTLMGVQGIEYGPVAEQMSGDV